MFYNRRGYYGRKSYEVVGSPESDENSNGSGDTSAGQPKKKKAKSEHPEDTTTVKHKVNEILKTVRSGSAYEFVISQKLTQSPTVVISFEDGNKLHFPIYESELDHILDLFEKSPYGKGSETILDTSFRNSYQISPDKFTILNLSWDNFIKETIVPLVAKEFSISDPFIASIYKLLLYKEGSFFKLHRDSEKERGMFATLIVQLPSKYTGGELVVHHDGKTKTIDYSTDAAPEAEFSTCFSAFYCDCLHEINPLKSGVRACLVYNLCLTGKNPKPMAAPSSTEAEDRLGTIFENWKELTKTRDGPSKIVYALKHKYTQKNLSFENLKSTDKAIGQLLKAVSTQHQMTLLLAIFEKISKGDENGDSDFDSDDSECYCEKEYQLTDLRQLDSSDSAISLLTKIKPISVELEEEVIPEDCWSVIKPYDSERQETGNEGVHVTLFYRHAAFVIWPTEHLFEVFVRGENIVKAESIFLQEYQNTRGISRDDLIEAKLLKWAWDLVNNYSGSDSENATQLLPVIADFNNLQLLKKFLQHRKILTPAKIPILVAQCEKYGWIALSTELLEMFKQYYERDTALEMLKLFITTTATNEEKIFVCTTLAQHVLESLVKPTGYGYTWYLYQPPPKTPAQKKLDNEAEKKFLKDFYTITRGIEFNMAQVAEKKPLDIIVPVLLELAVDKQEILRKSWKVMSQIVLKRMETIAAKSIPVPNYRRNDFHSCGCKDCQLLLEFMQSNEISKGFKMGKQRRLHLHQGMNHMEYLSHVTERIGNPQTMIVTKADKIGAEEHLEKEIVDKHMSELKKLLEESALK